MTVTKDKFLIMMISGKEVLIRIGDKNYNCAMDLAMDYIGGKWKTVILWYLRDDKKRFGELKKIMPRITEKMLSLQLKTLELDGIIQRVEYSELPVKKVEYSLTDFGKTLIPVIESIAKWGRDLSELKGERIYI